MKRDHRHQKILPKRLGIDTEVYCPSPLYYVCSGCTVGGNPVDPDAGHHGRIPAVPPFTPERRKRVQSPRHGVD